MKKMQQTKQNEQNEDNKVSSIVTSFTTKRARRDFVKEVMKLPGGKNILDCIQCGLCSGSCPTEFAMDYSPMQLIKMIHLGMREKVLACSTIWTCSACYTCYARCPQDINITSLMMSLKNLAMTEKAVDNSKLKPKFHKAFFEIVNKYGRLHEPILLTKILKKTDIKNLFHNANLGLRLFRKGKIGIMPVKIKQTKDLNTILEKTIEEES
jgi:heterodisulfide reductase subunit C